MSVKTPAKPGDTGAREESVPAHHGGVVFASIVPPETSGRSS